MTAKRRNSKQSRNIPFIDPNMIRFRECEFYYTFQEFLYYGEESLNRYPFNVSLMANPQFFHVERAVIIRERVKNQEDKYRLIANRRFLTICDRNFSSEEKAREAFTLIFAYLPEKLIPQVWTPFHKTAQKWMEKNFPDKKWTVPGEIKSRIPGEPENKNDQKILNPLFDRAASEFLNTLDLDTLNALNQEVGDEQLAPERISLLCNPNVFYLSGAIIVNSNGKFRLIVFQRSFLVIDTAFKKEDQAKTFFFTRYVETTINYKITPVWSAFLHPPHRIIDQVLDGLK